MQRNEEDEAKRRKREERETAAWSLRGLRLLPSAGVDTKGKVDAEDEGG